MNVEGGEFGTSVGIGSTIVNEGPVAPEFLENTMSVSLSSFKSTGEIIFNPFKGKEISSEPVNMIQQAEEVADAAWELSLASQSSTLEDKVVGYIESRPRSSVTTPVVPDVIQAQRTETALEAAGMVDLSSKLVTFIQPEVKSVVQPALVVPIPLAREQQIRQEVKEEEVLVEEKPDGIFEQTDKEEERILHTEDEHAALQRVREIIAAAVKIGFDGQQIASLIYEHQGNRSQELNIVDPDMRLTDGSLEAVKEELSSKKLSSLTDVAKNARELVSKHKAIKRGKEGKKVADQDMAKVYRKSPTIIHPAEMVIKRSEEKMAENPDLTEVFQKAA